MNKLKRKLKEFNKSSLDTHLCVGVIISFAIWGTNTSIIMKIWATICFIALSIVASRLLDITPIYVDKFIYVKDKITVFTFVISVVWYICYVITSVVIVAKVHGNFYLLIICIHLCTIATTFIQYNLDKMKDEK